MLERERTSIFRNHVLFAAVIASFALVLAVSLPSSGYAQPSDLLEVQQSQGEQYAPGADDEGDGETGNEAGDSSSDGAANNTEAGNEGETGNDAGENQGGVDDDGSIADAGDDDLGGEADADGAGATDDAGTVSVDEGLDPDGEDGGSPDEASGDADSDEAIGDGGFEGAEGDFDGSDESDDQELGAESEQDDDADQDGSDGAVDSGASAEGQEGADREPITVVDSADPQDGEEPQGSEDRPEQTDSSSPEDDTQASVESVNPSSTSSTASSSSSPSLSGTESAESSVSASSIAPKASAASSSSSSQSASSSSAASSSSSSSKSSSSSSSSSAQSSSSSSAASKPTGANSWKRLAGNTALDTMAEIAKEGFTSAETVVIATAEGYWDALAASSLAGTLHSPVLLTEPNKLSEQAKAQIKRLGATKAIICGGPKAISTNVDKQLKEAGVKTVERYAGSDAPGTARAIAEQAGFAHGMCIVATSDGYWDALSIAPFSYAYSIPIYLTELGTGMLGDETLQQIVDVGCSKVIIVGGTAVVKSGVVSQLEKKGISNVTRLAGPNAYATSVRIAQWELDFGMMADGMGVACGTGYWDALAGAALCGEKRSVLLLADAVNYSSSVVTINDYRSEIDQGYLFGGPVAISDEIAKKIRNGQTDTAFDSLTDVDLIGCTKIGIDVSAWQGVIDWQRVKGSGVDYAIIRIGHGLYVDEGDDASKSSKGTGSEKTDESNVPDGVTFGDDAFFSTYVKNAQAVGMPIGIYWYSLAEDEKEAALEAEHVIKLLKEAGLGPSSLPYGVWYDLEYYEMGKEENQELLYKIANAFCSRLEQAGYTPGIYANLNWWTHYLTGERYDKWSRWVAQYNDECYYEGPYVMWQCKSTGRIDGIAGNVDMDIYYG